MELLTLARYITEMALMYFEFSQMSESLVAASAFALASRMIEADKVDDSFWVHIHFLFSIHEMFYRHLHM